MKIYYDNLEFEDEEVFELFLLRRYLTKHYGYETAIEWMNTMNIKTLAKSLGKKDIGFFCEYFLRNIFVPSDDNAAKKLSKDHYELWELANKIFIDDEIDKANIVCPRCFAKTTIFDLSVITWNIAYKESIFTILINKDKDGAAKFLEDIKKVFLENEKIIENFGMLIDRKKYIVNSTEIQFVNGCDLQSVGSNTSIRGRKFNGIRPTLVIGDDCADDKDILTEESRQKKYDLWCKQVEEVGNTATYRNGKKINKATKIISIGTILHIDCLISRLSRNKSYYTILKRAIILKEDQTVDDIFESPLWLECKKLYFNPKDPNPKETAKQFYLEHKEEMHFPVLWEDSWDCFDDLAVKYWENRQTFMSEKMNDASSIGEKWFKSVNDRPKEYIDSFRFTKTMMCVDVASTVNKRSDFTCIIVGSETDNEFICIRDIVMKKLEFNDYCAEVVKALERNEDVKIIYIEKQTYSGSDVTKIKELIAKNPKLKGRRFEFINENQKRNKDEKISTIIDPVNNGKIIFNNECEDSQEAIQQMKDFQSCQYSAHDDFPDVVSELCTRIKEIKTMSILRVGNISDLYRR